LVAYYLRDQKVAGDGLAMKQARQSELSPKERQENLKQEK
jgi:hypothetical protein